SYLTRFIRSVPPARGAVLSLFVSATLWCERGDSNSHGLPHWNLNPARLPVPPLSPADPTRGHYSEQRRAAGGWIFGRAAGTGNGVREKRGQGPFLMHASRPLIRAGNEKGPDPSFPR